MNYEMHGSLYVNARVNNYKSKFELCMQFYFYTYPNSIIFS